MGSFRDGSIYEVSEDGSAEILFTDERLFSVVGIRLSPDGRRLFVANSDLGVGKRKSEEGAKRHASLLVYDMVARRVLAFVNLGALRPSGAHLANAIAVDSMGSAYITDSLSPIIYKVDTDYHASVFLEDPRFEGEGINLNGIRNYPDDETLLVAHKGQGALYRIPINAPSEFTQVAIDGEIIGVDGLIPIDEKNLALVANEALGVKTNSVVWLRSNDGWRSASVVKQTNLGNVYPTTGIYLSGQVLVLHSKLNRLMKAHGEETSQLQEQAHIQGVP
ncbi:MAG: hypothetical protein JKY56_23050 [Kofleriaceae bacterium]|nr:hypothetical protein [Kofleriaceae bacterium]